MKSFSPLAARVGGPFARFALTMAFALASAGFALPACAQQKLVPAQSEIAFTSKQMGVPVDGKFRKFDAQVAFDPKKPEAAKIGFTIDLASVSISAESDAEVVKQPWFDTAKFPQATFQSSSVKATGPGRFDVAGKLSMKGNVRDVVVPVTLTQTGGSTTVQGSFTLKRLEFKVGEGEWADTGMVANDVIVKVKLTLSGVGPI